MAEQYESMKVQKDMTRENVAAVCGNEMRVYGPVEFNKQHPKGIRTFKYIKVYPTHGAAKQAATEYEGGK